jgi:hypothetical protein
MNDLGAARGCVNGILIMLFLFAALVMFIRVFGG